MTRPESRLRIEKVLVAAKAHHPEALSFVKTLESELSAAGIALLYDDRTAQALGRPGGIPRDELPDDLDLVVVAGGDGTLLSVARSTVPRGIPVLGINLGSLGFLTELPRDEALDGVRKVLAGRFDIEERPTLCARYLAADSEPQVYPVLNDVVISKSALARMINISLTVDGADVATYTSDGLIVSSPTGSTAYNLSAGGPILDPTMSAFVITPICPHTMTYRPLVVPGPVRVEVRLRSEDEEVYLTLDGQIGHPFSPKDRLIIDDQSPPLRLVRVAGRTFFQVLRHKLRWGER